MLHSRGELLLMLDADGATKVYDLEKLEAQVGAIYLIHEVHKMHRNRGWWKTYIVSVILGVYIPYMHACSYSVLPIRFVQLLERR